MFIFISNACRSTIGFPSIIENNEIVNPEERASRCSYENLSEIPSFQIVKGLRGFSYDIK